MTKFETYLQQFDITASVTEEDVEKTTNLLNLYAPALRRSGQNIADLEDECFERRRQDISDFINLAIDFDHDADRKRIADRLYDIGHSMQLLSILQEAMISMRDESTRGRKYYDILRARYFDAYNKSNEDAYLSLGISSATYYRNIKPAIKLLSAHLWCVVIPNIIITEKMHESPLQS